MYEVDFLGFRITFNIANGVDSYRKLKLIVVLATVITPGHNGLLRSGEIVQLGLEDMLFNMAGDRFNITKNLSPASLYSTSSSLSWASGT
jgi:hypothetical protein